MQVVVDRALIPDPQDLVNLRQSLAAVLDSGLQHDPGRFFAFLNEPTTPLAVTSRPRRHLDGGVVMRRKFTTEYRPYGFDKPNGTNSLSNGDPVLVEHWLHDSGHPRGTVLALHGFAMGYPRIDAVVLCARQWFQRGLDVALMTLPHHGSRTPPEARFSGEWFAVPHVGRVAEAVREAVYEIRLVTTWLREQSGAPVGLIGLSLGGYLTALMAGLCEDLDFAVPIVPPVCIGDLAWRYFTRTRHYQMGVAPALSQDELRASFRIHSPLAHPLRTPRERVLIVAGTGDRIVPPDHPHTLWQHWDEPSIHWFSGSHLAPFGRRRIVRAISRHLESLGIL